MTLTTWQRYGSYKDSGVKWIGDVPADWRVKRLKHITRLISEKVSSKDSLLRYIGMENVESWSGHLVEGTSEVEGLASKFAAGDVIFGKLRPYLAKATKLLFSGICSTEFLVMRAENDVNSDFLSYLLRSWDFVNLIDSSTYGSKMPRANPSFVANCAVAVPPFQEQCKIAAFLDEKCAKVDEAVRIKEEQIALLRERRQILIQNAVTRGLDLSVPMKDSGVDWIGQIPAHWEIKPLLTEAKIKSKTNRPDLQLLSVYLNLGVVKFDDVEEKRTNATSLDLSKYQVVEPGDLVLNNQQAWRGSVGVSFETGIVSPAYIILGLSIRWDPGFANIYFRTGTSVANYLINSKGVGTIQRNLYWPQLKRSLVIIPPLEEQRSIVKHVNGECARIDSAIAIKEQQISALKEYKASLINAAVTGKIKVV